MRRSAPCACLLILSAFGADEARSRPAATPPEIGVILPALLSDARPPRRTDRDSWRLPRALFDLPAEDADTIRLRVKLKPNKAVGRVSFAF